MSDILEPCVPLNLGHRRSAFTLVELLIVVSIVALLIALLLPALKGARDAGRSVVCKSNLRQMGQAFGNYANDFKDYIPGVYINNGTYNWFNVLGKRGYFGPTQTFGAGAIPRSPLMYCPAEYEAKESPVTTSYYDYTYVGCSYAISLAVDYSAAYYNIPRRGWYKGPDDGKTARAPILTDCGDISTGWEMSFYTSHIDDPAYWDYVADHSGHYYTFRHVGATANMLYMDGHVAPIRHVNDGGGPNWKTLWSKPPP